jgi:rod shape determining protein RodA
VSRLLLPPGDKILVLAWLLLCLASLAVLWSVTEPVRGPYEQTDPGVAKTVFWRQVAWTLISWLAFLIAARLPLRYLEQLSILLFLSTVLLLLIILAVGPRIGGARRWLALGPLRLQPSELAKVTFVLVTAKLLGTAVGEGRRLGPAVLSFVVMAIPMMLVLREPDLGTSLVFLAIWLGAIFWFGMPGILLIGAGSIVVSAAIMFYSDIGDKAWPWGVYLVLVIGILYLAPLTTAARIALLGTNVAAGIGIPFFWERLKPYQQDRLLAFFDPSRDQFGTGYQAIQSKVAIGQGGLMGTGYLAGTQKGLAFLPERHTDFIFSVVGEELGFVGAVVVLGLFAVIILRGINHAEAARRPFASFLAIGVVSYFTFHVVVNVAITTGLLPVTGLPLPLLSSRTFDD